MGIQYRREDYGPFAVSELKKKFDVASIMEILFLPCEGRTLAVFISLALKATCSARSRFTVYLHL